MTTTIQEQDGNMVAIFEGRLDTAAASETEKALQPLLDCTGHNIVFDCRKLEYISSSGLRLLLAVLKNAKPKGIRVMIKDANADIRRVLDMTGFTNLFEMI